MNTLSKPNFKSLRQTCEAISKLAEEFERTDGMSDGAPLSKLTMLGNQIKAFLHNPIVYNSGIIQDIKTDIK